MVLYVVKCTKCGVGSTLKEGIVKGLKIDCPSCGQLSEYMRFHNLSDVSNSLGNILKLGDKEELVQACKKALAADQRLVNIKEHYDDQSRIQAELEEYFGFPKDKYPWYKGPTQDMVDLCMRESQTFHQGAKERETFQQIADILQEMIDGDAT